jgi:DNA invertase Pin-like site-specific DNA recombinase
MRARGVIWVSLAFLCLCAVPSFSLGQATRPEGPPRELWQKFPFNPRSPQAKEDGATRARPAPGKTDRGRPSRPGQKNAASAQPARRSARGEPGKGSGQGTAIPVAVVLPLGLLLIAGVVALPVAIRRRRSLGKDKATLRTAAAGGLTRAKSILHAAGPPRLGRAQTHSRPDHPAKPPPVGRRPDRVRPPTASATSPPAASARPRQDGSGSAAPASEPPRRKPAPGSAGRPAAPSPRSAPNSPADRAGRSAEANVSGRSLTGGEGAVHSAASGKVSARQAEPSAWAVGYASAAGGQRADGPELRAQAQAIEHACATRGLGLRRVVWDVGNDAGPDLERPGLTRALETIAGGQASCLVVSGLDRLSRSAADLGTLVEWLERRGNRLIAVDLDLDTAAPDGRLAARALAAVGGATGIEQKKLIRTGPNVARVQKRSSGRPAVADRPALERRIRAMRAEGMTLQAIADTLNAEGIPTLRGGTKWRPSSVQAATGYKRPRRTTRPRKELGPDR